MKEHPFFLQPCDSISSSSCPPMKAGLFPSSGRQAVRSSGLFHRDIIMFSFLVVVIEQIHIISDEVWFHLLSLDMPRFFTSTPHCLRGADIQQDTAECCWIHHLYQRRTALIWSRSLNFVSSTPKAILGEGSTLVDLPGTCIGVRALWSGVSILLDGCRTTSELQVWCCHCVS